MIERVISTESSLNSRNNSEKSRGKATAPTLERILAELRKLVGQVGPREMRGLAASWAESLKASERAEGPWGSAAHYELLAYDALAKGRPVWAYVCIRAAVDGYGVAGSAADEAGAEEVARIVAEAFFPPYRNDGELVEDVRQWACARLGTLHAEERRREPGHSEAKGASPTDTPVPVSLDLRHVWMFRFSESQRLGAPLRLSELARQLSLRSHDLMWLCTLLAVGRDIAFNRARQRWFGGDESLTVGMVLRMLAEAPEERVQLLGRLDLRYPLIRHRLVYLNTPMTRPGSGLEHRLLELDEAVLAHVEGRDYWPAGIDHAMRLHQPAASSAYYAAKLERLERAMSAAQSTGAPSFVAVGSPTRETSLAMTQALAAKEGRPVLEVTARGLLNDPNDLENLFRLAVREAVLRQAVLYVEADRTWTENPRGADALRAIDRSAAFFPRPILFDAPLEGDELLRRSLSRLFEVRVLPPSLDEQIAVWREAIATAGLPTVSDGTLRSRVCDMALNVEDIQRAARLAADEARMESPGDEVALPSVDRLRLLAASKLNQGMYAVAERISTTLSWDDLVLPDSHLEQLMEVVTYARYQRLVFEEWGFAAKLPYGRANSSLFTGPPGTGKTMVAGIIARELGMDLFRIDMSQVVSKYIGETEKNLARVFDEAARSHAVLLFDEADSLFAKRTEVKSSHDRYANLEVNYLLQRMESFNGITMLTSNFADNIDDAFARRIKFKISFPFPDERDRARLWRMMIPRQAAVAPDIDWARLGRGFELAGGSIKNAVLRAAFRAAEAGTCIDGVLLEQAGISECREQGKLVRVRDGRALIPDNIG